MSRTLTGPAVGMYTQCHWLQETWPRWKRKGHSGLRGLADEAASAESSVYSGVMLRGRCWSS